MARVLVVEDDPSSRDLLETLLRYKNHDVHAVQNGAEGLALAYALRPELIISDVFMPEMDGYDFTRHLRAEPKLATTRVMFYTATYVLDDVRQIAADCGVMHILTKPAEPQAVLAMVDAALSAGPTELVLAPNHETDREYRRLLTITLHRKVEELKIQVAAREQAEAALHRANAELEQRVQERTLVLATTNRRLQAEIAERKQIESALRTSAEQLRRLSLRLVSVQETERRHLARELHDEIGQLLTGLNLLLEIGTGFSLEALTARLREAQAIVNELTTRVRTLSLDLRPSMLDDLGLLPALQWHIQRYIAQTNIQVDFKHSGVERPLDPLIATTTYRIVQEALTNVARYAAVRHVELQVWVNTATLHIQVEDQGRGFDLDKALAVRRSAGIVGMQERARLVGGSVVIDTAPNEGTRVLAQLPLDPLHAEEGAGP